MLNTKTFILSQKSTPLFKIWKGIKIEAGFRGKLDLFILVLKLDIWTTGSPIL